MRPRWAGRQFTADGAYDGRPTYETVINHSAAAAIVIPPRASARMMPDKAIAGMVNRVGKRTGRSNGWTQARVRGFRNTHDIAVYRDGELAERGEVTLTDAARMLNLSPATVLRRIRAGIIPAEQYCKGAGEANSRESMQKGLPTFLHAFRPVPGNPAFN